MDRQPAPEGARGRGRPRSAERDIEIREAAWKLIAEVGCSALTFEGIAQSVGCSRATLYRRFATKGDLILHLLNETALAFAPQFAVDAPPREKLLAHARTCVAMYKGSRGPALIQIFAAARYDDAIASAVRAHGALVIPHYYEPLHALAPEAGERDIRFALHTLIGATIHHVAARGDLPSDRELERLVDAAIYIARTGGEL